MCDSIGRPAFLAMYLSAGVMSSWASLAYRVLLAGHGVSLGASGAIFGILAAWTYLYPEYDNSSPLHFTSSISS